VIKNTGKNKNFNIKDLHSSIVDGNMVKILSWYVIEQGYTNQSVREGFGIARTIGIILMLQKTNIKILLNI
jgi:hypothetical protein